MALRLFPSEAAELIDVPLLADQHRERGLRLMVGAAQPMGMHAAVPVTLTYGEFLGADAMVRELLRLANVGRIALEISGRRNATLPFALLEARLADGLLSKAMGPPRPADWLAGPAETAEPVL